jgi:hypothetical protein
VPVQIYNKPSPPLRQDTTIPPDFIWLEARWWGVLILSSALLAYFLVIGAGWKEILVVAGFSPIQLYLATLENK